MSETPTTCGSCGAQLAPSDTRCADCGSSVGASPAAALFSMSGAKADDYQAEVATEVGPYLAQAMTDFADEPDTIVATTTYLLYSIKRAYGPGDTVEILAYDPDSAGTPVEIGLYATGEQIALTKVALNEAGAGIARFTQVPAGVVEARFVQSVADATDQFVIVDAWPIGLQAALGDVRITGNPAQRWLDVTLQIGVSGTAYEGNVDLELLDRDNVVSSASARVADGQARAQLAAAGHSPHTLHVSAAGRDDTISVPLPWNLQPVELSPVDGGAAISLYPINSAWHKDGMYVLNGQGAELPDLGSQLAPTIDVSAHCKHGDTVTANLDAGVGARAFALVVIRAAASRGMHTPGRSIAARALSQLDSATGAPPTGVAVSCPPFDRGAVIHSQLYETDGSGRLTLQVPTEQSGDWVIDTFVMTDLGWGEAEARLRID